MMICHKILLIIIINSKNYLFLLRNNSDPPEVRRATAPVIIPNSGASGVGSQIGLLPIALVNECPAIFKIHVSELKFH